MLMSLCESLEAFSHPCLQVGITWVFFKCCRLGCTSRDSDLTGLGCILTVGFKSFLSDYVKRRLRIPKLGSKDLQRDKDSHAVNIRYITVTGEEIGGQKKMESSIPFSLTFDLGGRTTQNSKQDHQGYYSWMSIF